MTVSLQVVDVPIVSRVSDTIWSVNPDPNRESGSELGRHHKKNCLQNIFGRKKPGSGFTSTVPVPYKTENASFTITVPGKRKYSPPWQMVRNHDLVNRQDPNDDTNSN